MSSILKALQKLERDKDARKTKEPDISTAIKMSKTRSKEYPAWLVPFIVVTVAAVSILVTFSLMGGFSSRRQSTAQTSSQPQLPQTSNPQHLPASLRPETSIPQKQPLLPTQTVPVAVERKSKKTTVPAVPSSTMTPSQSTPDQPAIPAPEAFPVEHPPAVAEVKPAPKPKLIVSGIAWQSDSASRIAVVNGSSVSEGSSIGGAKVEQIFPDRVRFLRGGTAFELFLNQEGQ